jgi:UDP-N-acetylmuramate dehydrogenase
VNFKDLISQDASIDCFWDTDLTQQSTFRLASKGSLIIVRSISSLQRVLSILRENKLSYRMLGWGANQVLLPQEGILIKLDFPFQLNQLEDLKEEYVLPASLGLNHLTAAASRLCLKGWEVLTGIPASLGGAIAMNAGTALGEIASLVKSVRILRVNGDIENYFINDTSFSYRKNHFLNTGDIILDATLTHHGVDSSVPVKIKEYLNYRKSTQPLASKNCGCVFKNFGNTFKAGRMLDITGLKGLSVGALAVSLKHANFMENNGGANAEDFFELVRLINQQMQLHWGIEFELEVKAV